MAGDAVRRAYDRSAPYYNGIVRLLSFGGDMRYRRMAVEALGLRPGERVLDVGAGTGLNLPLLRRAVGPDGLVVATDLSRRMLQQVPPTAGARRVQVPATDCCFRPASFDAVLCTYLVSTLVDRHVLDPIVRVLRPGGRLALSDDKLPPGWFVGPGFMLRNLLRHGWPDLLRRTVTALRPHFAELTVRHCHYGMIFIISGVRR